MSGSTSSGQQQWIRKYQLICYASGNSSAPEANLNSTNGISVDSNRCTFHITQSDFTWQNLLQARVYNLADSTVQKIRKEFDKVILQAGYANGSFGLVFSGTILQVQWGKENNVDTFVDVLVGDGDQALNYTVVNQTISPGATPQQEVDAINSAMQKQDPNAQSQINQGQIVATPNALSRGKVLYGLPRALLDSPGQRQGLRYSIQSGVLTGVPVKGYMSGAAVAINSANGMISAPLQTEDGIMVRTLLNPLIKIGQLVHINQGDINQTQGGAGQPNAGQPLAPVPSGETAPSPHFFEPVTADGYYKVIAHEMTGDSRGQEWYSDLTCLTVDLSAPPGNAVVTTGS